MAQNSDCLQHWLPVLQVVKCKENDWLYNYIIPHLQSVTTNAKTCSSNEKHGEETN
jgi:hypothetical protein